MRAFRGARWWAAWVQWYPPPPASFNASFWARAARLVCAGRRAGWVKKPPGLRNWAGWGWLGRGWDKKLGALGGEFLIIGHLAVTGTL